MFWLQSLCSDMKLYYPATVHRVVRSFRSSREKNVENVTLMSWELRVSCLDWVCQVYRAVQPAYFPAAGAHPQANRHMMPASQGTMRAGELQQKPASRKTSSQAPTPRTPHLAGSRGQQHSRPLARDGRQILKSKGAGPGQMP